MIRYQVQQLLANERKKLAAADVPPLLPAALRSAVRAAIESAFVDAFRLVMLLSAALAIGGALCAWLLIRPRTGGRAVTGNDGKDGKGRQGDPHARAR